MHDFWFLVFQPNLDSELLHTAFAAAMAVFGGVVTVCGGLCLFLVKRAISKHDAWREKIERDIEALKIATSVTGVTDGRAKTLPVAGPPGGRLGGT